VTWLLRLYPAQWRERYGEEFAAVLASQRASVGMVLDVVSGAIDAHLYPQVQTSHSKSIQGENTMTLEMLQRCAAGGPKLSPQDRRIASLVMILSGLAMAGLYVGLTKIYHAAPAVQALFYASFPSLCLVYGEAAYLRKRPWLTQVFILGGGLSGMYLFMLAVCVVGARL
jgi:hypothetical protein